MTARKVRVVLWSCGVTRTYVSEGVMHEVCLSGEVGAWGVDVSVGVGQGG